MSSENKENIIYFEAGTMKDLFGEMKDWQGKNKKRLLSTSILQDGARFCCIALTNPSEVVITSQDGERYANVNKQGSLQTI